MFLFIHTYLYFYISLCVCVCVCINESTLIPQTIILNHKAHSRNVSLCLCVTSFSNSFFRETWSNLPVLYLFFQFNIVQMQNLSSLIYLRIIYDIFICRILQYMYCSFGIANCGKLTKVFVHNYFCLALQYLLLLTKTLL